MQLFPFLLLTFIKNMLNNLIQCGPLRSQCLKDFTLSKITFHRAEYVTPRDVFEKRIAPTTYAHHKVQKEKIVNNFIVFYPNKLFVAKLIIDIILIFQRGNNDKLYEVSLSGPPQIISNPQNLLQEFTLLVSDFLQIEHQGNLEKLKLELMKRFLGKKKSKSVLACNKELRKVINKLDKFLVECQHILTSTKRDNYSQFMNKSTRLLYLTPPVFLIGDCQANTNALKKYVITVEMFEHIRNLPAVRQFVENNMITEDYLELWFALFSLNFRQIARKFFDGIDDASALNTDTELKTAFIRTLNCESSFAQQAVRHNFWAPIVEDIEVTEQTFRIIQKSLTPVDAGSVEEQPLLEPISADVEFEEQVTTKDKIEAVEDEIVEMVESFTMNEMIAYGGVSIAALAIGGYFIFRR